MSPLQVDIKLCTQSTFTNFKALTNSYIGIIEKCNEFSGSHKK